MAKIPYEYDIDAPVRGGEPGAKLRLVLIFAVILAVTAAAIWLVMPRENDGDKTPVAGNAAEVPSQAESVLPEGVSQTAGETSAAGTPVTETSAGEAVQPEVAEERVEDGRDSAAGNETPAAETTPLEEAPVKGKPWAGDPAETAVSPDAAEQKERSLSLANQLFFDSGSGAGAVIHQVKGGESLSRISRLYHTTIEGLRRTNGLKNSNIRIGQKLRVIPGPWRIEVSKSRKVLRLFRKNASGNEELFYLFDIGIGRLNRTPSADFVVFDRIYHPKWYAPDGAVYPYGDPGNPLGDYFLKLAPAGKPGKPLTGYGIHGTADDTAVGRSLSNGCIRMHNRDVERLWMAVPVGTAVSVKD